MQYYFYTNTFDSPICFSMKQYTVSISYSKSAFIGVIYINGVQNLLLDINDKKFTPHTQELLTFVILLHINTEPKVIENIFVSFISRYFIIKIDIFAHFQANVN